MEINISSLFTAESPFVPFDCSNNRATLGDDAGRLTWNASVETAKEIILLDTPEKLEAMRDFAQSSGGWTREEIDTWSAEEVNALFLQWIAGDVRELFGDAEFSDWDWADAEAQQEAGQASSNIYRGDDGSVYFYLGS